MTKLYYNFVVYPWHLFRRLGQIRCSAVTAHLIYEPIPLIAGSGCEQLLTDKNELIFKARCLLHSETAGATLTSSW